MKSNLPNVYLESGLGVSFLKAAIKCGHARIVENDGYSDAKKSIDRFKKALGKSRQIDQALLFGLLADTVYIDNTSFDWEVWYGGDDPIDGYVRWIIEDVTPEFDALYSRANSRSKGKFEISKYPEEQLAQAYNDLEPVIWANWRKEKVRICRKDLVTMLNIFLQFPKLSKSHERPLLYPSVELDFPDTVPNAMYWAVDECYEALKIDQSIYKDYFRQVAFLTARHGYRALSSIELSRSESAFLPISGLTKNRNNSARTDLIQKKDDVIVGVKLFLDEVNSLPIINDFDDLLRVKSHKEFQTFQGYLRAWIDAILEGDEASIKSISKEVKSAHRSLEKAVSCGNVGRIFTYTGIPLAVVDFLTGVLVLGMTATISGVGMQLSSDLLRKKGDWLMVGR